LKPRTLILGIGSPFGDDRTGWAAADAVRATGWFRSHSREAVDVDRLDRPGVGLLAAIEGTAHVVLLDAMVSGLGPGTIRQVEFDDLGAQPGGLTSSHGFDLGGALRLGRALNLLPPRITLLTVEAGWSDGEDPLSAEVRAALPELVRRVQACIAGAECSLSSQQSFRHR